MAAAIVTPLGYSLPPEGPHTVTFHIPKWESAIKLKDGDLGLISQLKSIYPRFFPFGPSAQVLASSRGSFRLTNITHRLSRSSVIR